MGLYTNDFQENELSKRIKEYQNDHNLSRKELAADLGVAYGLFSKLEMTNLTLTEKTYNKIGKALELDTLEVMRMRRSKINEE